jgi:hypothetical protein
LKARCNAGFFYARYCYSLLKKLPMSRRESIHHPREKKPSSTASFTTSKDLNRLALARGSGVAGLSTNKGTGPFQNCEFKQHTPHSLPAWHPCSFPCLPANGLQRGDSAAATRPSLSVRRTDGSLANHASGLQESQTGRKRLLPTKSGRSVILQRGQSH